MGKIRLVCAQMTFGNLVAFDIRFIDERGNKLSIVDQNEKNISVLAYISDIL